VRKLNLNYIGHLVADMPKLLPDRRPKPMPGKRWPTRVAWHIRLADYRNTPNGALRFFNHRILSYVGKPNRYRALEARNFLQQIHRKNVALLAMWQAEFDKAGLVAYQTHNWGHDKYQQASGAFAAYHPHSSSVEIVEAFIKPLYLKYVGGMRLYSQKKKLPMEALDAYYDWYHKTFKRRLRRPKALPSMVIAGQVVEPTEVGTMEEPE
jgi:hypothetical protein